MLNGWIREISGGVAAAGNERAARTASRKAVHRVKMRRADGALR